MALVKTVNLGKVFQEKSVPVTALSSVSIEIEKGEFVAISGPSGSGKTTLLNLIGCLDRPTQGQIYLDGEEVGKLHQKALTPFRLRKIGFIFQDYNLIPTLTAGENIEYVLWLQGMGASERRKRIHEVAERFGITSLIHRRPWQLSRGQQQRAAVARAIVHKPRIVLGDELTANLDQKTGIGLMEFLKELNEKEKITFLYATHDPTMMKYADRIIKIQDGRILEGSLV
ncbi:MAG: ABC transporter ATP-binding protein [Candidatus Omnitrophica bacterium]|nr:ABC transporter ATP-binding protein [Candidatus Omnitrophota bacterium]